MAAVILKKARVKRRIPEIMEMDRVSPKLRATPQIIQNNPMIPERVLIIKTRLMIPEIMEMTWIIPRPITTMMEPIIPVKTLRTTKAVPLTVTAA